MTQLFAGVLFLMTMTSSLAFGSLDLSGIPPAKNTQESYATFDLRAKRVLNTYSTMFSDRYNSDRLTNYAARMALGLGTDVEAFILNPSTKVEAKPGTDFHDAGFLCARTGDYDFTLRALTALMYRFGDDPKSISPQARYKILASLLNQKGNQVHLTNNLGLCGTWPETENHILMTETSRYLTNQLMERAFGDAGQYQAIYDNQANGMNDWMLKHLQEFFKKDFSEYNSHPYQTHTVLAIQNLFEFAEDPRVKTAAEMLLNYLDAKFAISSNALRRYTPFRRQKVYRDRTDMLMVDSETTRMTLMAGNTQLFAELERPFVFENTFDQLVAPALGKYRTPELILDLVIDKSKTPYFNLFSHTGLEIYASSPSFLITGGGIWINKFDLWTRQNSGWAVATTLMPSRGGIDASNFIRIAGHQEYEKRINTCVAPGFACGLNPVIPSSIPSACLERRGNFTFVDFTSPACPLHYGFYSVVYDAPCDSSKCRDGGGRFGFFEAREPNISYAAFRDYILAANAQRPYHADGVNEYVNSYGQSILFTPNVSGKWDWGIIGIDAKFFKNDLGAWPLALGDIMNADRSGLVTINNPALRRRLVLDMRDALNPKRTEQAY